MECVTKLCHVPCQISVAYRDILLHDTFFMGQRIAVTLLQDRAAQGLSLTLYLIFSIFHEANRSFVELNIAWIRNALIFVASHLDVKCMTLRATSGLVRSLCALTFLALHNLFRIYRGEQAIL